MVKSLKLVFLLLCFATQQALAQKDLFQEAERKKEQGFVIGFDGAFEKPFADMASRFGNNWRIGLHPMYKTKSGWYIGLNGQFLFGGKIKQDSLLINVKDEYGTIISTNNEREMVQMFERGYSLGIDVAKNIPLSKRFPDRGLLIRSGIGFIQHKIFFTLYENNFRPLAEDYKKGYDRLTNGLYYEQFIGYNYFSPSGFVNFTIGVNALFGFTEGRRAYLFDVQRPDTGKRLDGLFGVKLTWYLPIFKRDASEYYFE